MDSHPSSSLADYGKIQGRLAPTILSCVLCGLKQRPQGFNPNRVKQLSGLLPEMLLLEAGGGARDGQATYGDLLECELIEAVACSQDASLLTAIEEQGVLLRANKEIVPGTPGSE